MYMINIQLLAVTVSCQALSILDREMLLQLGMFIEFDLIYSQSECVLITKLQRVSTFGHQIYCKFVGPFCNIQLRICLIDNHTT